MRIQIRLSALLAFTTIVSGATAGQAIQTLSLREAEQIAIQNHPQIQAAANLAAAAQAQVTQARSAYYPTVYGSLTGVDAEHNSRIAAGGLNNPIIYERYSNGLTVSQLLTDFGRTHELVKSSDQRAQAQQENVVTTRAGVILQVDGAFYAVLRAQAVLTVADQTVQSRQLVSDQITELAKNKIKSGLDVSFANVDLAQSQLLQIQARDDLQSSYAQLSEALAYSDQRTFHLADESLPPPPSADVAPLIQQALRDRPEMIGQRLDVQSAQSYATAERDLRFPTISALGVAGLTPYAEFPLVRDTPLLDSTSTFRSLTVICIRRWSRRLLLVPAPRINICAACRTVSSATFRWLG